MAQKSPPFYEFAGLRLYPAQSCLIRARDGRQAFIRPKEKDFFIALLKKPRETVTYEELRQEVWPEFKEVRAALPTIRETKRSLGQLLKDLSHTPDGSIQTVINQGYRLNANVTVGQDEDESGQDSHSLPRPDGLAVSELQPHQPEESPDEASPVEEISLPQPLIVRPKATDKPAALFGGHLRHVVSACALYSTLYVVALLLEIAYQFDHFGAKALLLAPLVFLWIFVTSLVSLAVVARLTLRGHATGLVIALFMLLGSGLSLYVALGWFLPDFSITESQYQAHTAQGAYLKNVCYFLPLAVIFLLLVFHFVISLQREMKEGRHRRVRDLLLDKRRSVAPENTIYLKVWHLGALLTGAAVLSLLLTFFLLDNLKPNPYLNLFTQLVFLRMLLYFALGMECLLWYSHTLNALKRECLSF